MTPTGPVVCVSYVALAELWAVPVFPAANHGTGVKSIESSIAADGPMTAAALAALGVPSLLIANDIGLDPAGEAVERWLREHGVTSTSMRKVALATPRIAVVTDDRHTRTWFAHLPSVVDSLANESLDALDRASFVYLDCYELIESAALCVIQRAKRAGVPLLLNLGGETMSPAVAAAVDGCDELVVQTNVDDDDSGAAPQQARSLFDCTKARWVVVTAGAAGAVAVNGSETVVVPAFPVTVRHTHCAGAAFSAGLLYGLRAGWSMERSLLLGSASGALRCERAQQEPLPSFEKLEALAGSLIWQVPTDVTTR